MGVLAFVLWFVSLLSCMAIARQKSRSLLRWFFPGLLFGFLALVVLAALPSRRSRDGAERHWFGTRWGRLRLALGAVVLSFIQLLILLFAMAEFSRPPDGETTAPVVSVRATPTPTRVVSAAPASSSQSAAFTSRGSARSQVFQLDKGRYEVVVDIETRSYAADTWAFAIFRIPGQVLLLDQRGRGVWSGEVLVADASWSLWFALDALGDNAGWTVTIDRVGDLPRPTPQPVRTSRPTTAPSPMPTATPTPTPIPTATPTPTPIPLTLTELLDEYEANKVRANARLRYQQNGNVPVSTSGYIYHIEETYIVLAPTSDEYPSHDLRCYYADTRVALYVSKGQAVSIIGRVSGTDGWSNSISMYKCEVDGIVLESNPTVLVHDLRGNVVQVFCIIDGLIFSGGQRGTGIIVDTEEGIILTVHHVVADVNKCQRIEVEVAGIEGRVPATTVRHCASIDRARLQIPQTYLRSLSFAPIFRANAPAQADQEVYFLGYGPGELRMESGIVTEASGRNVVIDAYAVPGDSGSPVFDENGHLLGTVSRSNSSDITVFTGDEC